MLTEYNHPRDYELDINPLIFDVVPNSFMNKLHDEKKLDEGLFPASWGVLVV